jgi:hypothetical protein
VFTKEKFYSRGGKNSKNAVCFGKMATADSKIAIIKTQMGKYLS